MFICIRIKIIRIHINGQIHLHLTGFRFISHLLIEIVQTKNNYKTSIKINTNCYKLIVWKIEYTSVHRCFRKDATTAALDIATHTTNINKTVSASNFRILRLFPGISFQFWFLMLNLQISEFEFNFFCFAKLKNFISVSLHLHCCYYLFSQKGKGFHCLDIRGTATLCLPPPPP